MKVKLTVEAEDVAMVDAAKEAIEGLGCVVLETEYVQEAVPAHFPLTGSRLAVYNAVPMDHFATPVEIATSIDVPGGTAIGRCSELHLHLGLIERQIINGRAAYKRP
jgi:hypothetical protein